MATSTRDAADKATWSQMAKRWLACAEYHEDEQSTLGTRAESRHRKIHVGLRLPLATLETSVPGSGRTLHQEGAGPSRSGSELSFTSVASVIHFFA